MSGSSVTISDMQSFVENMDSSDIQISSNIGNVIELGGEELNDDFFGASLLSNSRVSARPAGQSSLSQSVAPLEPINDIGISEPLEPLEAISFDIPTGNSVPTLPEISINKSSSDGDSNMFSNEQSATGPSFNLSSANRINPEEERKKKAELINKLNRLESKGYTLSKHFSMDNNLDEIQLEYDRLVDAKNLEGSIKFQRQCLMGAVTGFEFLNGKFNPFDWQLEGWSESVHENIEDYDEVFEELYDKYKGKGNMPPEAKLLMTLVGSGFMFHMSNSFFRQKMANVDPGDIFRNNPDLAKQFAAAAAQQAGPGFGNFMGAAIGVQGTPQQAMPQMPSTPGPFYQSSNSMNAGGPPMPQMPQNMAAASAPSVQRREMRGPSGVDDILKTYQEVRAAELESSPTFVPQQQPSVFNQQPARQAANEIASIHSQQDDGMAELESVRTGTTNQRRGRRKAAMPIANTMTLNL
jgi:Family of unknown function (DUF5767)